MARRGGRKPQAIKRFHLGAKRNEKKRRERAYESLKRQRDRT